ncbi:MAG: helix-turn-helix domain-containing protein [Roseibium sp.]|uniref:helix-turn-helix domain-containing protein n=1 Tax=Roseibium sp. TaxID=1936156 RepID=UPI001B15289F|nr:helix-turn-helix domain-containing protein [Roseibium sp.]MBO6892849.1 helix-turn-helix domain-containing protein [Roseibium sp.]MBO6927950.1 helix-turn-helix domain-containing protein [Roseibium sp.]
MALLEPNDILFAQKAILLTPDLSAAARRVAAAIIDHFNKKTGQCDPGINRLVKLLGMSRATVIRATETLNELGFIEKQSHGGKSHRAAYIPNWQLFRQIVDDWDTQMKSKSGPEEVTKDEEKTTTKVSKQKHSRSQKCDVKGLNSATQTLRSNQSNKPFETEQVETPVEKPQRPPDRGRAQKALKNGVWRSQTNFLLPMEGGKQNSRGEVARDAAQRRWELDAKSQGEHVYAAVAEWITPERQHAATEAELKRKGGGFDFIAASMHSERRFAHG